MPAEKQSPAPLTTTTRTSSGRACADRGERVPHPRRLAVAAVGLVQGDREYGAVEVDARGLPGEPLGLHDAHAAEPRGIGSGQAEDGPVVGEVDA